MTFLPIVERELRVAARRPGTYWTRWFAALGMMVVWLLFFGSNHRASAAELNKTLFVALGILALGFCLLAGIFLTADCLSEEKREGTLGLLFLTDLRGYDVVLGKLIATSVHSVYGLLAILPALALPLMMGGVTVGEFWRVVLVLAATLFVSLSMGMFVSAAVRETRQAMAGTLLGLVLMAGLPPALRWLGSILFHIWPSGLMVWPSPACAFVAALDASYRGYSGSYDFWMSLLTVSWLSLGLLVLAAVWLPRAWQEKAGDARRNSVGVRPKDQGGAPGPRGPARLPQFLDAGPYLWLASRARSSDLLTRLLVGLLVVVWLCFLAPSLVLEDGRAAFVVCLFSAYAVHQVAKYLVALEAARQLSEDRRSGALELLLVTPLPEAQILTGQKHALRRRSRGLQRVLLLVNAGMCLAVLARPKQLQMSSTDQAVFLGLFLGGILVLFADFKALETVGMWMALRARKHHRAVLGTLGRVMLVPWAGVFLLVFLGVTGAFNPSEGELATVFGLWFMVGMVTDLGFSAQARAGLGRGLRYWVAGAETGDRGRYQSSEPSTLVALNA
jgi:ABC-type transport system involved in cytochrome c biogenesis permease component